MMKHFKLLFAGFAFFLSLPLCAQQTANIWPGLAPGTGNEKDQEKAVNNRIYNVYQPNLTVYLPSKPNGNRPAVVICPGGGYMYLAIELEGTEVARWLNEDGVAAFVLKYRLDSGEALEDAKRAMSFVRANAAEYDVNPGMIGIAGFSAGGQVAAGLATHHQRTVINDRVDSVSCKPDFMILGYPALDWLHPNADEEYAQSGGKNGVFVPFYRLVDKDAPPTFIVHAANDKTVPVGQSLQFFTALEEAGVPCELHVYEEGGHGFGLGTGRGAVDSWPGLCVEWMKTEGILAK
ncbi:MAG TPA: alpha/beta hydrolase [Candidatus Kryptobacter bacterium]|nr:alpha/beta hydrolase [Candidatus Kryptobacter bacterium]